MFNWFWMIWWRIVYFVTGDVIIPGEDDDIRTNKEILMSLVSKINALGDVLFAVKAKVEGLGAPVTATLDPAVAADIAGLKSDLAALTKTVNDLVAGVDPDVVPAPAPEPVVVGSVVEPVVDVATSESEGTIVVGEPQ